MKTGIRSAFLQLQQQVDMAITWFPPSAKLVSQCRFDESHQIAHKKITEFIR